MFKKGSFNDRQRLVTYLWSCTCTPYLHKNYRSLADAKEPKALLAARRDWNVPLANRSESGRNYSAQRSRICLQRVGIWVLILTNLFNVSATVVPGTKLYKKNSGVGEVSFLSTGGKILSKSSSVLTNLSMNNSNTPRTFFSSNLAGHQFSEWLFFLNGRERNWIAYSCVLPLALVIWQLSANNSKFCWGQVNTHHLRNISKIE